MYKLRDVENIIKDILNTWYNLQAEFEKRLNNSWLNNNNGANEHLRDDFLDDFIEDYLSKKELDPEFESEVVNIWSYEDDLMEK